MAALSITQHIRPSVRNSAIPITLNRCVNIAANIDSNALSTYCTFSTIVGTYHTDRINIDQLLALTQSHVSDTNQYCVQNHSQSEDIATFLKYKMLTRAFFFKIAQCLSIYCARTRTHTATYKCHVVVNMTAVNELVSMSNNFSVFIHNSLF